MQIRSIRAGEVPQVLELIREAFAFYTETADEKNGAVHHAMFADVYAREDLDASLLIVAEEDGQLVSMASFLPKQVQMGERVVPGVILSPVGTLPLHRGKGLAEQILRYGLALAREKGYAFSTVLGHPEYYPRVGYVPVFPWHRPVKSVETVEGVVAATVRGYEGGDVEALAAFYQKEMGHRAFYPVRTLAWWEREMQVMIADGVQKEGHPFEKAEEFAVFVRDGRTVGYASLGGADGKLQVKECCTDGYEHVPSVYAALMETAKERGCEEVVCAFPLDTPFGLYMKERGAKEVAHAPSAWMMQLLDWEAWLEAHVAVRKRVLALDADVEVRVELAEAFAQETEARVQVRFGQQAFAFACSSVALTQLVTGLHAVEELQAMRKLAVGAVEARILGMLFPKREPYFHIGDALF